MYKSNSNKELVMTFDEKMTKLFAEMGIQVDPVVVEDESEEK
jgi:hypothetical protein